MRTLYFALWFLLSSFFSSPNLSRRRLDVYHTSTQWCGLSANLRRRSETCCTRLAENTGHKKSPKISPPRHHVTCTLCRAISSQLRHVSTIGKTLFSSNSSSTCPRNIANVSPLTAEIGLLLRAPQQISTGFASWQRYCTTL